MAAQLNYGYDTAKAVPGAKVDLVDDIVEARRNEEADGVLKFGMAVMVGSTAGQTVKIPVAGTTAAQIDGVVICHPNTEQNMNGNVIVKKDTTMGVMKKGKIWGRLATDVTPVYNATAYVVVDGDDAGCFTATADDAKTVDIGATFGNATDDGIAIIVLN